MMIEVDLVDRQEIHHGGKWCCYEILDVPCPACGKGTNIVITWPDYSEYHHPRGVWCGVYWTEEEMIHELLVLPGYIRD
jgi:hypothetical protein